MREIKFIHDIDQVYYEVINIINSSTEFLCLVSAYFDIEKETVRLRRFKDAMNKAIKREALTFPNIT